MPDSPAPRPDRDRLRAAIVAAGRRLGARGLISAGEGNLSVRLDGATILVTPSGRRKDELAAEDLIEVPLAPAAASAGSGAAPAGEPRPSSDIAIHRAVYAARPDVEAIVHAHLPAAMALTLAGEIPDPGVLPETAHFLPRLPFVPFEAMGSDVLAARIAAALTDGPLPFPGAALLERHGAVAVGDALDQAVDRLELVEVLCRAWRDAILLRAAGGTADPRAILPARTARPRTAARGSPRR